MVGLTAVETVNLGCLQQNFDGDYMVASFDRGAEGLSQMINGYVDTPEDGR
jgi:hypothetical protein